MAENKYLTLILTIALVMVRLATYVTSPLWLDALRGNVSDQTGTNYSTARQVDPYFVVLTQALTPTILYGGSFLAILISCRNQLTDADWMYPKKYLLITGAAQAVSALMINFALSGTRSPPYLIALLGNFLVPVQFLVRFFILHKVPTRRKVLCAGSVVVAELICLLPSIFPGLDHSKSHHESGGEFSGPGAVLFPLSFVAGLVPGTMVNAFMERSVKDADHSAEKTDTPSDVKQLNIAFYQFGFSLAFLVITLCLFWIDLVPSYGTSSGIHDFGESLSFNFLCLFGQGDCGAYVVSLGWLTILMNSLYTLFNSYLLRHSEGANYMTVAMTTRSPLLFLFWTLFDETHFRWHPHVSLSTWLSIASIAVMVPAVYFYNTGAPERDSAGFTCCCRCHAGRCSCLSSTEVEGEPGEDEDRDPLLQQPGYVQYRE